MADVFKSVGGRKTEKFIAELDVVQDWLDDYVFEARVRAEADLLNHRAEGHAFIEVNKGRIDRYLILNDENGQSAAMSIEYGREPYEVEREDGTTFRVEGMEGLGILHKAVKVRLGSLRGTGGGKLK